MADSSSAGDKGTVEVAQCEGKDGGDVNEDPGSPGKDCIVAQTAKSGKIVNVKWDDGLVTPPMDGTSSDFLPPAGQSFETGNFLYNGCTGEWAWVQNGQPPPANPQDLAVTAAASVTVTTPPMQVNPAWTLQDGRKATMKNAYTWIWSEKSTWISLTPRAQTGAVWAQATITPTTIIITPGDGTTAPVQCAGRGTPLPDGVSLSTPSPTCSIQLGKQTSGATWPMSIQVRYTVTWTGFTGTTTVGGTLPDLVSAPAACPIAVLTAKTQLVDADQPSTTGLKLKPGATLSGWCANP